MKLLFAFSALILGICLLLSFRQSEEPLSPLAEYSTAWNDMKYKRCNTAEKIKYLTPDEKEVIHILNLARMNPVLFANTVVKQYPPKYGRSYLLYSDYYKSLLDTMKKLKPINLLAPDSIFYESALCHAISSGKKAYVGHVRQSDDCQKKTRFYGECCQYGYKDPISIVLSLLIDEGVPSLGHRDILLSPYKTVGVSIQPHNSYGYNAVLDFGY